MADIPQSWAAYARLQHKVSNTTNVEHGAALERALNVILQPNFSIEATTDDDFLRAAASAGRQCRHRALLRRRYPGELLIASPLLEPEYNNDGERAWSSSHSSSLEDAVYARQQLERIESQLTIDDFSLLLDLAAGVSYHELARGRDVASGALRTRVARLRDALDATTLLADDSSIRRRVAAPQRCGGTGESHA